MDHMPLIANFNPAKGTRWASTLNQYDLVVNYKSTEDHGHTLALSCLLADRDDDFDKREEWSDVKIVCNVRELSRQLNPVNPKRITQQTEKDHFLSKVQRYTNKKEPSKLPVEMEYLKNLKDSLLTDSGYLFYGARFIIPDKLSSKATSLEMLWDAVDKTTSKISG